MKKYVQFWTESTGYVAGSVPPRFEKQAVRPIEACGDGAVVRLDGRESDATALPFCRTECRRRGYIGFTIIAGESLLLAKECRGYEAVSTVETGNFKDGGRYGQVL